MKSDDRGSFTETDFGSSAVTVRASKSRSPIPARLLRGMYARRLGISCTYVFSRLCVLELSPHAPSSLARTGLRPHESSRHMSKVVKTLRILEVTYPRRPRIRRFKSSNFGDDFMLNS